MNCGLLGRLLGHSYSCQIHEKLADYHYQLYEKEPEELEDFIRNGDYTGLNVTIPYKKTVIPLLDTLSPIAQELGAVNTIVRRKDGRLMGHNTDFFGFSSMLERSGLQAEGKKALVLGSGGASATAQAVLRKAGAQVAMISRSGEDNYENLHKHRDAALIVNATPLGMYPRVGVSPLSLDEFPALEGVLDLIYNPARTKLLLDAEERGLVAQNGLWMLVAQAWESAQWFTGSRIPQERIPQIHRQLRMQMENLVLIGMPGCGKTTLGAALAQAMGREFVDADRVLEDRFGPIPEIFATQGEGAFRALEAQVLAELGKRSGLVIATGGGCVTRQENYRSLHQNGIIFYVQRPLEQLPTNGRPLSSQQGTAVLFEARQPLYLDFSDHAVENTKEPQAAVDAILKIWEEAL